MDSGDTHVCFRTVSVTTPFRDAITLLRSYGVDVFIVDADHNELDAQVSATNPHRAGERHLQHALERVQHLHVRRDFVHCSHRLPERTDHAAQDRPQPVR